MALELGPCSVAFGVKGSEVSLGKTHGGVSVSIVDDSVDLKSDQYGSSPEDTIITGTTVGVELALAEITLDRLATALNQTGAAHETAGTPGDTIATPGENNVGTSMLDNAGSLLLKKYVDGAASVATADQIRFPAACPVADVALSYDAENQRILKLKFTCFPKLITDYWGTDTADVVKTVSYIFGDESDIGT